MTPGNIVDSLAAIGKLFGLSGQRVGLDLLLGAIALALIVAGIWGIANQSGAVNIVASAAKVAA